MASASTDESNFDPFTLNLSPFSQYVTLSSSWQNSTQDNDIYDMPKRFNDCGISTNTSEEQSNTEGKCRNKIKKWLLCSDISASAYLDRRKTIEYLLNGIRSLPGGYSSQDCSRTWVVYWILNSIYLLNADAYINNKLQTNIINFLKTCQVPKNGGFGGGPIQYGHVAASFGAVMALMTIGTPEAYNAIDREGFYKFLLSLKQEDGSFCTQYGGEIDIRAIYCGLACASLLNILDSQLCINSINWLQSCQTYQGGFSQEINDEAHGGYAYCGVATTIIIKKFLNNNDAKIIGIDKINIKSLFKDFNGLIRWASMKQMSYSGGFCGRTNKLVDACYSFWVGALFPMINIIETIEKNENINLIQNNENKEENDENNDNNNSNNDNDNGGNNSNENNNNNNVKQQQDKTVNDVNQTENERKSDDEDGWDWFDVKGIENKEYFDTLQLQKYLLIVAQYHNGGITDKPFKPADYYHTCYGLSGLSIAQSYGKVLGPKTNKLNKLDPVFGIIEEKAISAREYFLKLPKINVQDNNDENQNDN